MDVIQVSQAILALIFVLGLIALMATFARKLGFGHPTTLGKRGGKKRLGIIEIMPLDNRRRLVLVRHDDREHLLLLGQQSECVVESGREATDLSLQPGELDDEQTKTPSPFARLISQANPAASPPTKRESS